MLRAMQTAISDTTSKSEIFMERFQQKYVWLTDWHDTNQDGWTKSAADICAEADYN